MVASPFLQLLTPLLWQVLLTPVPTMLSPYPLLALPSVSQLRIYPVHCVVRGPFLCEWAELFPSPPQGGRPHS